MQILKKYLKNYWKVVLLVLVLAAINQIFSLLDPYIMSIVLDKYVTHFRDYELNAFVKGVGLLLLAGIGVAFVSRIAKNFQDYFLNTITQRVGAQMYARGVEHSLLVPFEVFEDQRSGETLGKLQKMRSDVEKYLTALINVLFISLVGFVFVTIYSISISYFIALSFLLTVPIIATLSYVLSRKIKKVQTQIVAETTMLAGSTTESLRNIELVKSLGLADQEIARLNTTTGKILELELKKLRYIRSISFVQGTCINLLRSGIVFLMFYLIFKGVISIGEFFSLLLYSFYVFGPLQELGNVINTYRETKVSLELYESILNIPVESAPENPKKIGKLQNLEFKNVSFNYLTGKNPALSNINFQIKAGETVAFVGPSGSGKTTLVKLLVGLYKVKEGDVIYNNISSNEIDIKELRSMLGFVTQDTQLFAGTIRENLIFVKPDATDEEINLVLEKSASGSLLERADKGIETTIGEGGVKVSGGEKQRLSIARALLRNPSLLVFDEATSALDSITEEEITKTIRELSDKTQNSHMTVLIAHRLSTIMHADKIFVLEKGVISESGKHDELIKKDGLYRAMWRQQIGEREE